jgi:hypothetical protein
MRILATCIALLLARAPVTPLGAQDHSAEIRSTVPALQAYHAVIFPLWHTAWPNKDTAMMARLLPDVIRGADSIRGATLPGILRDKKPAWEAGVRKLDTTVTAYRIAVEAQNRENLMAAAEQLHSRYEALVRIVRPVLKEIEAFHSVLYMLYHYYWPDGDMPNIRQSALALNEKMSGLDSAALPKRLETRSETFARARADLRRAVQSLQDLVIRKSGTPSAEDLKAAVTRVHNHYQALEKAFD